MNRLTKRDISISLEPLMLMLFGNPHLLQEDHLFSHFERVTTEGVFCRGICEGRALTLPCNLVLTNYLLASTPHPASIGIPSVYCVRGMFLIET